jgi:hypothetical protein
MRTINIEGKVYEWNHIRQRREACQLIATIMDFLSSLIMSSQGPSKTSLFIRGLLLSVAPLVMLFLGWSGTDVSQFADSFSNIGFWLLSIVAVGQMLWGLARKALVGRWAAIR